MTDSRIHKFAHILTGYSADIQPGDRVLLEGTTEAMPLIEALFERIMEIGGYPYLDVKFPTQEKIFFKYANQEQLAESPIFRKLAYEEFESRIRIHSLADTEALKDVPLEKISARGKAMSPILATQMRRGAANEFKWVTTLYPTGAYARQAGMELEDYQDFVFKAVHADTDDPVSYWKKVDAEQQRMVDLFAGKDKVVLRGPNVDLRLSIKDRAFLNASGRHNMPDGEIFSGPVEDSVNGWVRFTYPTIYEGVVVEGVELEFVEGRVLTAKAAKNQDFLLKMLDSDPGARYVGEFAVGLNFEIDRFTGHILFDEKIGGSFHMALGAGYPDTGSVNKSQIHWDMICDMRTDSEISVDNQVIYRNGAFLLD